MSLPVRLQPLNIRPIAYRIFSKKHGLNLQTEALGVLLEAVESRFGQEWKLPKSQQFLEELAKLWKQQNRGLFVDGDGLTHVLQELTKDKETNQEELSWQDFFKIATPDKVPRYAFDKSRKHFALVEAEGELAGNLAANLGYFSERYHLIRDRLSRNEHFQGASLSSFSLHGGPAGNDITLVKNVLGRDGQKFILFGLLSKNVNDNFILEDGSDHIELNLTQAYKTEGLFYCAGMYVIVEGIYLASGGSINNGNVISGCFHVSNIGQPPVEKRDVSLDHYGNLDFLGIHEEVSAMPLKIDRPMRKRLVAIERSLTSHKVVFLGCNCHLDDAKVMAGLRKFFAQVENELLDESSVPLCVVMGGLFVLQPLTGTNSLVSLISNSENYKNNFDNLAELVSKFANVTRKVKLVLVPGPNDPWQLTYSLGGQNVLPQKPVLKVFVNRLERLLKGNLVLGWNPTRIGYLSQEICILRDDIMNKLKRNDIVFAQDDAPPKSLAVEHIDTSSTNISPKIKQARKLVKTLLDQGHLQPFLPSVKVVNANYGAALRIEPLPTTLVLMDLQFENFEVTYNGCKVVNVGSIGGSGGRRFNYVEYWPAAKKYEFKEL